MSDEFSHKPKGGGEPNGWRREKWRGTWEATMLNGNGNKDSKSIGPLRAKKKDRGTCGNTRHHYARTLGHRGHLDQGLAPCGHRAGASAALCTVDRRW